MSKTPKLRFKEFSGDWIKTTIGNEFNISSGTTPSKAKKDYFNGCNCWVTSGELKSKYINSTIDRISEKALTEYNLKKYPIGTFIIAIYGLEASGTRGSCSILNTEATISQACMAFTPKSNISTEFLYYWYMKYGEKIGIKYAQGTKQQNLSTDLVSNINISVPSIQEQEKIVSFISLIDDKISLQNEKIEMLKDYKKGMMQKIFSRELRFKDDEGRDYPDWEEKQFGEVLTSRIEKQVPSQEAPLMSFTSNGGIEPKGDKYDRSFLVKSDNKLYKRTELNDFIYSSNNLDVGSIGLNKYGTAVISDVYEIFKISKENSCDFISELIQTPKVLNKVIRYRQGVMYGQYRIHADEFLKIKECIPCLEEQKKISNFIINVDQKIEKEQEKLHSLNEYKKGLLQQMFV